MTGFRPHTAGRIVILLVTALLTVTLMEGQTGKRSTASRKKPAKVSSEASRKKRADSLAAVARADSVHQALKEAAAREDSALAAEARRRAEPSHVRKVQNIAFTVGEELEFDVSYGLIKAGTATMAIPAYDEVNGRKCYRVEFNVRSLKSFDWIYKVDDHYLTFIDVEAIIPWRFEQHVSEGNYRRDFTADFDQVNHRAKTTEGEYPIPENVHDIMSAFYYARTVDFSGSKQGDQITLYNFYKDKSYELAVKFLGRQELEVEAGTFKTIVVEPLVKEGGLFKSEGRIVIWLSDDDRKVPVRVNTKVVIGSIDVELTGYTGVAGPLTSRVK